MKVRQAVAVQETIHNGVRYFRMTELSEITNTSIPTLNRWLNNGELVNFLTIYKDDKDVAYYRLGLPEEDDVLLPGESFKYKLKF